MLDDFRLRVFMMAAAQGSFTRAAQHLGVSQPAVSQNIAELEKQVGAVLFERKRGEVTLTPEGYVFKDYAARILHWYDATDALFGSAGKMTVNRPVRIAATDFVATHFLPDLLRDLLAVTATSFIIDTYPESAFPESMDADLYYFTSARGDTLNFDAGSIVGTVQAALVTAGPDFPEEPRYAVWAPYRPLVICRLGSLPSAGEPGYLCPVRPGLRQSSRAPGPHPHQCEHGRCHPFPGRRKPDHPSGPPPASPAGSPPPHLRRLFPLHHRPMALFPFLGINSGILWPEA